MEAKQEVPSWLESLAYEHQHKSSSRGRSKRYITINLFCWLTSCLFPRRFEVFTLESCEGYQPIVDVPPGSLVDLEPGITVRRPVEEASTAAAEDETLEVMEEAAALVGVRKRDFLFLGQAKLPTESGITENLNIRADAGIRRRKSVQLLQIKVNFFIAVYLTSDLVLHRWLWWQLLQQRRLRRKLQPLW